MPHVRNGSGNEWLPLLETGVKTMFLLPIPEQGLLYVAATVLQAGK
jgi:hypothetical protein